MLGDAPGFPRREDAAHARDVARALRPFVDPSKILAPRRAA